LRYEPGDDGAICAEKQNGIEGDKNRGEDTGDDGFFGYADVGTQAGEEEEQRGDDRRRKGGATMVFFLKNAGEDEGEGNDANASKLVDRKGRVAAALGKFNVNENEAGGHLREGKVAKHHFEAEDDGQWKHLLGYMPVKFEQAASCDPSRAISHPPYKPEYGGLLLGW
jgi:hypothetical protein